SSRKSGGAGPTPLLKLLVHHPTFSFNILLLENCKLAFFFRMIPWGFRLLLQSCPQPRSNYSRYLIYKCKVQFTSVSECLLEGWHTTCSCKKTSQLNLQLQVSETRNLRRRGRAGGTVFSVCERRAPPDTKGRTSDEEDDAAGSGRGRRDRDGVWLDR